MLKRLKRLWELTNKDKNTLDAFMKLTDKEIMSIPDKGYGKAVFLGEGTHEEFIEQEREDKFGTKKLFNL